MSDGPRAVSQLQDVLLTYALSPLHVIAPCIMCFSCHYDFCPRGAAVRETEANILLVYVDYCIDRPWHSFVRRLLNFQSDPAFADRIRLARDAKRRMAAVWSYCKGKMVCEADAEPEEPDGSEQPEVPKRGHGGCGHIQPQIRKEGLKLFLQYKRSKNDEDEEFKAAQPDKRPFTPAEVYNVLRKISDDDLALLGLSEEYARPDWMILTVLPVPPPPVRPSISTDGGALRSEDDLTYKLGDVIKASANVRRCEEEGAPAHVISEFEQLLQVSSAMHGK